MSKQAAAEILELFINEVVLRVRTADFTPRAVLAGQVEALQDAFRHEVADRVRSVRDAQTEITETLRTELARFELKWSDITDLAILAGQVEALLYENPAVQRAVTRLVSNEIQTTDILSIKNADNVISDVVTDRLQQITTTEWADLLSGVEITATF